MLALTLALTAWIPLPISYPLISINVDILFILAISSLAIYFILWSGWASDSKYSLIGALRAVAQTISYEVMLAVTLFSVLLINGSFTLSTVIITQEHLWLIFSWPLPRIYLYTSRNPTKPHLIKHSRIKPCIWLQCRKHSGPIHPVLPREYVNIIIINIFTTICF